MSLLGRRSWKDRYFVLQVGLLLGREAGLTALVAVGFSPTPPPRQGGLLSYYTDQGASEAGAEPLKEALTLRYYAVDACVGV